MNETEQEANVPAAVPILSSDNQLRKTIPSMFANEGIESYDLDG